jgi:phosphohistidine phosphatase
MELYLVRHAIAFERDSSRWPNDGDRPLTPEGEQRFRLAARGLKRLVPAVDVSLASPFARAWRTAEILTEEAGWPPPEPSVELQAERSAADAVRAIRSHVSKPAVAVVGHEPNLSELASLLLAGAERLVAIELKKGGVIALGLDQVRPGVAYLRWAITPKALRSLAR